MNASESNFGKRLTTLRKSARLTRHQLARRAGLQVTDLTHLERSEGTPKANTIKALANALNVSTEDLRTRE
jgi:transcriptional regulator with XRE-family HTH domain